MPCTTAVVVAAPAPAWDPVKEGKSNSDEAAEISPHKAHKEEPDQERSPLTREITPEEPAQEPAPEPAPLSREELLGHRVALLKHKPLTAAAQRLGWRSLTLRMAASLRSLGEDLDDAPPPGLELPGLGAEGRDAPGAAETGFAAPCGGLVFRDDEAEEEDGCQQEMRNQAGAVPLGECIEGEVAQGTVPVDARNPPPPASAMAGEWHDSLGNVIQVTPGCQGHATTALLAGPTGTKVLPIQLDWWGFLHCGNGVLYQVDYEAQGSQKNCLVRLSWRTSNWRTSTWRRTGVPPPRKAGVAGLDQEGEACGGSKGKGKGKGGWKAVEQRYNANDRSKGKGKGKGGFTQQWQ